MRDDGMNLRLLLVEDDPVSQAYLADAARALPAEVDCAGSVAEALLLAAQHRYDAWLIDAHLPDGNGPDLLARLRTAHPLPRIPALAHTASTVAEDLMRLRTAGFDAAISKPLAPDAWQSAIRRCLPDTAPTPTWDDASALRALNGNADAVASLRQLFLAELPRQQQAIKAALDAGDADAAQAELHRLKASCGFVGALQMRRAVDELHAGLFDRAAREQFDIATASTISASTHVADSA